MAHDPGNCYEENCTICEAYKPAVNKGIWYNRLTKMYAFQDETERLQGEYMTEEEALLAMEDYAKHL